MTPEQEIHTEAAIRTALNNAPTDEIIAEIKVRGGNVADVGNMSRDEIITRAVTLRMIVVVIQESKEI